MLNQPFTFEHLLHCWPLCTELVHVHVVQRKQCDPFQSSHRMFALFFQEHLKDSEHGQKIWGGCV